MQNQPRYSLLRRILFPYSGRELLTPRQGLLVIASWALFFAVVLSLCSFPFYLLVAAHAHHHITILFFLLAFLAGVVIFGVLGWLVVAMNNRAVRIIQRHQAAETSTNGGRYGS
jgi:hypothetical protein